MKKTFLLISIITLFSCTTKKHKKVPIDTLNSSIKNTGENIVEDILQSLAFTDIFVANKGAVYLLNKPYTSPKLHGGIKLNEKMYARAYFNINRILGKINSYKLFEVVDKDIIKSMKYKLEVEAKDIKFVELQIDVNLKNKLVAYYLYVTSEDGTLKKQNVLPVIKMTY